MLPTLYNNTNSYRNPFDVFRDLERAFNRDGGEEGMGTATYPVDIHELEDQIVIEAEMPGFRKDEIDVNLENGVLTINGVRQSEEKQGEQHLNERRYARVQRRFTMPNTVDPQGVAATLQDGVLTLTLPKREETKPRKISIN